MRGKLLRPLLAIAVFLVPVPAAASSFTITLPADSAVAIGSPSRLVFNVTNPGTGQGLSGLTLSFPAGYRITGGSAPAGWTVELRPGNPEDKGAEITFWTRDEVKCRGAIAPGHSLVFGVEVVAPASGVVTPDSLVSAEGEQSCGGVILDPPTTLPSWNRLGIESTLAAGPGVVGLGGDVTVTMTVTNLSTVELTDVSALLRPTGTGSVSGVEGPTPPNLTLAPGTSGALTWTTRAASAGTVGFSGQALSKSLTSPPIRSDPVLITDLDVSLSVAPERLVSGEEVQVQMTVTNRGPVTVANVVPSPLSFEGTAAASVLVGPSPASLTELEPGESGAFAWVATILGDAGATYAFSGSASAGWEPLFSTNSVSNQGTLAEGALASEPAHRGRGLAAGRGPLGSENGENGRSPASDAINGRGSRAGVAFTTSTGTSGQSSGGNGTSATSDGTGGQGSGGGAVSTGGSAPPPPASASLQFIGVNHNGSQTGGSYYSGDVLRDLRILTQWQNLSGTHTQRLQLFSPNGSLYQRRSTLFSGSSVETRLPVGGTWITEHSLFGAWRVEVYLDSQRMPITSGVFVLNP